MVLKSLNKNIEKIMTEIKVGFIFSHIMLSIKKTLLLLVVDQYSGVLPELTMAFETPACHSVHEKANFLSVEGPYPVPATSGCETEGKLNVHCCSFT